MITIVGIIVIAVIILVAKSLLTEEIRGWIDQLPAWMLCRAARYLPPEEEDTLTAAWLPDLAFEQHKAEGRPLTRLVIGISFAGHLLVTTPMEARHRRRSAAEYSVTDAPELTATAEAVAPDADRQVHVGAHARRLSAYPCPIPTGNLPPQVVPLQPAGARAGGAAPTVTVNTDGIYGLSSEARAGIWQLFQQSAVVAGDHWALGN